jgi:hypothetical protein
VSIASDVLLLRYALAPIKILSTAQRIGAVLAAILLRRGRVAFHQTRRVFENYASLYSVARSDGARQRSF